MKGKNMATRTKAQLEAEVSGLRKTCDALNVAVREVRADHEAESKTTSREVEELKGCLDEWEKTTRRLEKSMEVLIDERGKARGVAVALSDALGVVMADW
jgi:predicted  nucleic acid-binding Zn-ribbon protein